MNKSYIYISLVLSLFIIYGTFITYNGLEDNNLYDSVCIDNGYSGKSLNPDTETSTTEFDDKNFVNCQNKIMIDGKLEITNDWVEINYDLNNYIIETFIFLLIGIFLLVFTLYALNRNDWN